MGCSKEKRSIEDVCFVKAIQVGHDDGKSRISIEKTTENAFYAVDVMRFIQIYLNSKMILKMQQE